MEFIGYGPQMLRPPREVLLELHAHCQPNKKDTEYSTEDREEIPAHRLP